VSCSKFETDIALYAGGDLPAGRIARIESHLAECADCRGLAEELRTDRTLLGELRDEPLEDAMVAQVRRRVLAEVGAATRQPARLYWKLALAAAVVLAVALLWPRHPAPRGEAPRAVAASRPAPVEAGWEPAAGRGPAPHVRKHRPRRSVPAAQPGPPLLVQFVTDDPNIVIYWLVDQKPQGD
jgi:anti-sigma factor RsiW